MCGIAAFVSAHDWNRPADRQMIADLEAALAHAQAAGPDWQAVAGVLDDVAAAFDRLMAFPLCAALITEPETEAMLLALADKIAALEAAATARSRQAGAAEILETVAEGLRDYHWQLTREALAAPAELARLTPAPPAELPRAAQFTAWAIARVLGAIDKLEVRGRDSLGLSVVLSLPAGDDPAAMLSGAEARLARDETASGRITVGVDDDGHPAVRFVYKTANLVGRLGDNSDALRAAMRADPLLWALAARARGVNLLAHTRWASNGIINLPNCHPADGLLAGADPQTGPGASLCSAINGDIDNYAYLLANTVTARQQALPAAVSTDAKILPVLFAHNTDPATDAFDRFTGALRACQGSLAAALQRLEAPQSLLIGQMGSGQALYAGHTADGWMLASEVYGLATVCRSCLAINAGGNGGVAVQLRGDAPTPIAARYLSGGEAWQARAEPIQIFARDIYRGDYAYYIDKEIAEAPESIRRTLQGKYRKGDRRIDWLLDGFGRKDALRRRLDHGGAQPLRRIVCIGQGTAAAAALGIAHLLRDALRGAGLEIEAAKASEFFGFVGNDRLDDTLLIAVSQSGTTTDTNRIVDIARGRGAWIQAIVNRRNSALVQKADSHLYTSNGRDVEMSVASTKAYYAQVAAGKLLALFLADRFATLTPVAIYDQICELESLAAKLETVLERRDAITALARKHATTARNWAIVGNGANRIAAEEIRIKLSELCYKAIPCDVTEDKKHIDLSTEPLTLVVANDLPEMVVQDTVKEVAIFKAHNGRPLVLHQDGETRFDGVAESGIALPVIGAGLGFVLATMAGHLFGIAAAKAIDTAAVPFRQLRGRLAALEAGTARWDRAGLTADLIAALDGLEAGGADNALAASQVAALNRYVRDLQAKPDPLAMADAELVRLTAILNRVIEDLTRPIDTIRHQAKTVTVGISRPTGEVSPLVLETLRALGCRPEQVAAADRKRLEAVSPVITDVPGGLLYDVIAADDAQEPGWTLQARAGTGTSSAEQSRYAAPAPARGSKRTALRRRAAVCAAGRAEGGDVLVLPLLGDNGNAITRLALLHLRIAPQGSLQQKTLILKAFGEKYDDLRDRLQERPDAPELSALLTALPLHAVIFSEVGALLAHDPAGGAETGPL